MAWCRKRQALLRISQGHYVPVLAPTSLLRLGTALVRGRQVAPWGAQGPSCFCGRPLWLKGGPPAILLWSWLFCVCICASIHACVWLICPPRAFCV